MQLSPAQLKEFDELGYLVMPGCFSEEETAVLRSEAEAIYQTDRQEVWRETSGAPRTAFAAHTYNEAFGILGRHPRLIRPLEQFFGEPVYMHQFKINAKAAFDGELWQWHQDYGTWKRDDGMPEPRAMNISVFLDEVMPINGPLMETVTKLVEEGGIVAPTGKPGTVLMFHGNLAHASPPNITPYPRKIVYLTLCAVSNHITQFNRAEWIAHRDFTPIVACEDDALLKLARQQRRAA
jgi:ectoine hydroxylase